MICSKCGDDKPTTDFHTCSKSKSKVHSWCKACRKTYDAARHKSNQATVIAQKAAIRARNRQFVYDFLCRSKCAACGEHDPVVLEFHHVGKKEFAIAEVCNRLVSLDRIEREIKKCEVLCANDHRRKTAKELGWYRYQRSVAQPA